MEGLFFLSLPTTIMSIMKVTVNSPDLISLSHILQATVSDDKRSDLEEKQYVLLPRFCILITAVIYLGSPKDSFYEVITVLSQITSGPT